MSDWRRENDHAIAIAELARTMEELRSRVLTLEEERAKYDVRLKVLENLVFLSSSHKVFMTR